MGPQVSYFAPQILMEEDIHGPGVDADGAAFPGVNLYVELGHGSDYAWSATSAGQNIIDTFAVSLCNPSGGPVTTGSNDYILHGQCVPMETLTRLGPSLLDQVESDYPINDEPGHGAGVATRCALTRSSSGRSERSCSP